MSAPVDALPGKPIVSGGGMLAWAGSLAVFLSIKALWWLASHAGWVSRVFLPTPEATLASLREGLDQGELLDYAGAPLQRMALGWLLASLVGLIGFASNSALSLAERMLLKWQRD